MLKRSKRLLLACAAGFGAAMLFMAVAIYFGYREAYGTGADDVAVRLCGLSIYHITKSAGGYIGETIGPHMGAACGVCMTAAIFVEELIYRLRRR